MGLSPYRPAWLLVSLLLIWVVPQPLAAQLKLEPDEVVKVQYLGDWIDGLVVEKGPQNQYLVEFSFANADRREVFHRAQIRKRYEFEGLDYGRSWQSASGTFKVEASLLRVEGDNVILVKPDMDQVTVPLDRLSTKDQNYVKKFTKERDQAVLAGQIPAVWPALPAIESFAVTPFGSQSTASPAAAPLKPFGELPDYLREFRQAGVGFQLIRPAQELASIIPVGGPDQLILVNGRESNFFNRGLRFQSQLYWLSMKQQKVLEAVAITAEDYALDYDPRSRRLLTLHRQEHGSDSQEPEHVTLWELEIGQSDPRPLLRWDVSDKDSAFRELSFGRIIDDSIVLTQRDETTYVGWDVKEKKVAYTIDSQSFFGAPVRLSPDRSHLIVPEDGRISIFDARNGKLVMTSAVDARHVSGANVNAAGNRLAAVTERSILVWDLTAENSPPEVYPAPLVGSPFSSTIDWVDDEKVIVSVFNGRILYSLKLKLPLWSYTTANPFFDDQPLVNYVLNGILFYTEQDFFNSQMVAVGAVELPGPSVEEVTANIDRQSLMAVKAGTPVDIELIDVQSSSRVQGWLEAKIRDNGWVYQPGAEIVLTAEMGIGATRTVEYGQFGSMKATTSVSYRPHFSTLKVIRGSQILWQTGTSTGAPHFVRGDASQLQSTIDSYQKPNVGFFQDVVVDAEIIDPKYSRGFGESKLGRRGIEVVSTTPPGRPDDPLAAAAEFAKDREQAQEDRRSLGQESNRDGAAEPGATGNSGSDRQ